MSKGSNSGRLGRGEWWNLRRSSRDASLDVGGQNSAVCLCRGGGGGLMVLLGVCFGRGELMYPFVAFGKSSFTEVVAVETGLE